jgi:hypothetical protein
MGESRRWEAGNGCDPTAILTFALPMIVFEPDEMAERLPKDFAGKDDQRYRRLVA